MPTLINRGTYSFFFLMGHPAFQFMNTVSSYRTIDALWVKEQIHASVPKKANHKLSASHTLRILPFMQ